MHDRLIGLAYVCARWHGGLRSRGYRLLCRIQWQPRGQAERLLPREEFTEARQWAAHYTRRARRQPHLF
jgi:hypothetical protein